MNTDRAGWTSMRQLKLTEVNDSGVACPKCGMEFDTKGGMRKHHAQKHGSTKVEIKCAACGDTFREIPARADKRRCCSRECLAQHQSETHSGESSPSWKGGKVTQTCQTCGDEFEVYPYKTEHESKGQFCGNPCYHEAQRELVGSDHPLWRGGKSLLDATRRSLGGWYCARDEARSRDGHTCQMCDTDTAATGEKLDVHHLIPVMAGGVNEPELLLCLCRRCHNKAEAYTRSIPEIRPVISDMGD